MSRNFEAYHMRFLQLPVTSIESTQVKDLV
jgi:hypothetical protein